METENQILYYCGGTNHVFVIIDAEEKSILFTSCMEGGRLFITTHMKQMTLLLHMHMERNKKLFPHYSEGIDKCLYSIHLG